MLAWFLGLDQAAQSGDPSLKLLHDSGVLACMTVDFICVQNLLKGWEGPHCECVHRPYMGNTDACMGADRGASLLGDQETYRSVDSRMAQESLRRHVLRVLRVWRSWFIFSDDFLNGLQASARRRTETLPSEEACRGWPRRTARKGAQASLG